MTTETDLIAELAEHAKQLRKAAAEITAEGHNGWGNACLFAAEAIESATLTRIIESEATIRAGYDALVIRLGEVTTRLEAERASLASLLPGAYYMDPPDGGDVSVIEQVRRMAKDAQTERALQRAAEVLPEGYGLTIYVERDSGYADLTDPNGGVVPFDTDVHGMAEQINNAIDAALVDMHNSAREGSE